MLVAFTPYILRFLLLASDVLIRKEERGKEDEDLKPIAAGTAPVK